MNTSDDFLDHLAQKLGRKRRTGVTPPEWKNKPSQLDATPDSAMLLQQFCQNLVKLNTEVDLVLRTEFRSALMRIVEKYGTQSVLYWKDERLESLGLSSLLMEAGLETCDWSLDTKQSEGELRAFAARADMGITYAERGLSETGTVVLMNGGSRGRVVSLLPPFM